MFRRQSSGVFQATLHGLGNCRDQALRVLNCRFCSEQALWFQHCSLVTGLKNRHLQIMQGFSKLDQPLRDRLECWVDLISCITTEQTLMFGPIQECPVIRISYDHVVKSTTQTWPLAL